MSPDALVGAWSLERFVVRVDDGRPPLFPLGPDAEGLVVYAASGWMSAVLSRSARTGVGSTLEEASRGDEQAKAAAFDSYLSYAGRWRRVGDEVHHEVELALVPGVAGQTLTRRAHLEGDTLTLSYHRPTRSGARATYTLTWSRR